MFDQSRVRQGMTVYSADGEKLGKVVQLDAGGFLIEKGLFFPKDYRASYQHIADVRGDNEIHLSLTKAEFKDASTEPAESTGMETGPARTGSGIGAREEITVPVSEDQVEVRKRERQSGAVRVTKEIVTEEKEIRVPVSREEVRVERVPVPGAPTAPPDVAFREGTTTVPVYEEEVEIRKRPVVKEEVRIRKDRVEEERAASTTVRREEVKVDENVDRSRSTDPNKRNV